MKHLLLTCLLLLTTPVLASSGTEAVIAAEKARDAALLGGDTEKLADLLADDLHYVHSTGKLETKRIVLDGIASKQVRYERMVTSDLHAADITPTVVVLNGKIDQRKLSGGKWGEVKLLFQAVWRNEAATWRLVSLQTALPPPPTP